MTKKQMPSSSSQSWRRIHHYPLLLLLLLLLLFFLLIRHARAQPANANSAAATAPPPPNPYGFNGNFNPPSLAIIIVIVVSAFFVVGFLTIYIHQCAGGSHLPTTTRRRTLGLNPEIIDSFPTFLYSYVKDLKIGKGALECAVCLSEFEEQETLRWLPKCDHVFHPDCIDAWLSSHSTCPVCRSDLSVAAPTPTTLIPTTTTPISSTNEERNSEQDHDIQFQNQSLNLIEINTLAYETASTAAEEAPTNSRGIPVEKRRVVTGRFPRSHSTGHSAVRPGEDCERFTLRLPEEVRRQLVESTAAAAAAKMKRAKSCVERGEGSVSSRRWWRVGGGGEGSSRGRGLQFWGTGSWSDRWVFARAPSFFSRGGSVKSPKIADGEGSTRGNSKRSFVTSVTAPFDCIGSKAEVEETPANFDRLPV